MNVGDIETFQPFLMPKNRLDELGGVFKPSIVPPARSDGFEWPYARENEGEDRHIDAVRSSSSKRNPQIPHFLRDRVPACQDPDELSIL